MNFCMKVIFKKYKNIKLEFKKRVNKNLLDKYELKGTNYKINK